MASLSKQAIQRLATLCAVSLWRRGAYGPVRVHKTLFFADQAADDPDWHLFTFKRNYLGQYSDELSDALNGLQMADCIRLFCDGDSVRFVATISSSARSKIERLFRQYFSEWRKALGPAFKKWAYLRNDDVIRLAHDDPSYKKSHHGQVILSSFNAQMVKFDEELSDEDAEFLSDLVDEKLHDGLIERTEAAAQRGPRAEDWRSTYFGASRSPDDASANGQHRSRRATA
jgi:hypothetical protein